MANFIRIRSQYSSNPERDIVINADGVLEVRVGSISRYMDIIYEDPLSATKTIGVTIDFPVGYTVTDSDLQEMRKVIEKSCQTPGAIPYFVSSDGTKARYAYAPTTAPDKLS